MPEPSQINAQAGDTLLLVGTMKGAFIFRSDGAREKWDVAGPYFPGRSVYAMNFDGRNGRQRLWAAVNSSFWGSFLSSSNDFGKTWSDPEAYNIKFPEGSEVSLKQIWQIVPGHPSEPDTLYCGVEPAALFKSTDAGETWLLERGLFDHPHRTQWMPGGGGLCLHTILPDAANDQRLFVAISTGGVYRTDDGGQNWQPRNKGIFVKFLPPGQQYPEWGQCVHKVVRHAANPDRMFLQHHWGVYRSDDAGDSWIDIGKGLRTKNAGESWEALTEGLPQEDAFETILRDSMKADANDPTGLYFGTRNGRLFGSNNGGDSWTAISEGLPAITCVKTATVS